MTTGEPLFIPATILVAQHERERMCDYESNGSGPLMTNERVPFDHLVDVMCAVLVSHEMERERAATCATLFADASRDGVASHGLNRFPRFITMIENGSVDVHARPTRVTAHGGLERWNGQRGPGNLNARECMARAIDISRAHGLGAVALSNTNHWMRGGSYGWQAADAGVVAFCWTNTLPNLPPWGSSVPLVGNNPLVIAVPRSDGHVVLDMAMSQFSYGAISSYRSRGEQLPVVGGYGPDDALTTDPAAIEATGRMLPIGFWKGSGLALLLDMVAALLSGGRATHEIPPVAERECGLSQVFIAFDAGSVTAGNAPAMVMDDIVDRIVDQLHSGAEAIGEHVRYPGERTLETRQQSLAEGVVVDSAIWADVCALRQHP
ncbi:MAG: 3-dehydro-L-gulonate 2-dehydrogenase [bacterium]